MNFKINGHRPNVIPKYSYIDQIFDILDNDKHIKNVTYGMSVKYKNQRYFMLLNFLL